MGSRLFKRSRSRRKTGVTAQGCLSLIVLLAVFGLISRFGLAPIVLVVALAFVVGAILRTRASAGPRSSLPAAMAPDAVSTKLSMKPEEVVPVVLERWETMNEGQIARLETILRINAGAMAEAALLYALRVSIAGIRAKKLATLAGRWKTARSGAGGTGLEAGRASRNFAAVESFLAARYAAQIESLVTSDLESAVAKIQSRKTPRARANAAQRALLAITGPLDQISAEADPLAPLARTLRDRAALTLSPFATASSPAPD